MLGGFRGPEFSEPQIIKKWARPVQLKKSRASPGGCEAKSTATAGNDRFACERSCQTFPARAGESSLVLQAMRGEPRARPASPDRTRVHATAASAHRFASDLIRRRLV